MGSERLEQRINKYLTNFVEKFGYGNENQRQKLRELIKDNERINIQSSVLNSMLKSENIKYEYSLFKNKMMESKLKTKDDFLTTYVKTFGMGNEKTRGFLEHLISEKLPDWAKHSKEYIEESKRIAWERRKTDKRKQYIYQTKFDIKSLLDVGFKQSEPKKSTTFIYREVKRKFEELRKDKELEEFERELGIVKKRNTKFFTKKDDVVERLLQKKVLWEDIKNLSGYEFEDFIVELCKKIGYTVRKTKLSGDQGADIIIEKFDERTVIQTKNHKNQITNKAVQEVIAARSYYSCDKAIVIGTSDYTNSAKDLAKKSNVDLWDKEKLMKMVDMYINTCII